LNDITPNSKLTFNDGDTYTITGAAGLNLDGQALGTEVIILSDNPGTQFTFDLTGGAQTVNRVNVTDSAASSNNITANNSVNNGGNDDGDPVPHWIFSNVTITVPSAGTTVGQTPTVIGTAPPGNIVILKGTVGAVPLQQVASATADALGNYIIMQSNYTANLDIAAPNSIRAEVGVIQSSLLNINVVATPTSNQVPTIISPAEGSSVNGNKPTITGKGVAGQTVTLTVKDAAGNLLLTDVATTIVDGLGNWTISSPDYTTNLVKGINYLSATVSGTVSDIRTISLTDPFGIVFDSTTDNPIGGATVTIYNNATGLPCTPGVEIALADANPQTTGAGGAYSFLCANGNYYIIVSALGYSYPSTKTSFPAGRVIVNGSKGEVFTVASVIIQMDHPLDSGNQLLRIKKDVNKKEVVIGEVVTYTITIKNETASDVTNVYLEDMIPAGFKYINDRAILDNRQISNPTGNRPITFNIGTVSSGQTRILKYQLVVGSGVTTGNYKNSAVCKYSDGTIISNKDSETVKVTLDPLFDLGTIIGKVFWDRNEDRSQNTDDRRQKTEIGIRGVQIVMEDGTIVTTDADGKYHVPAILPGRHVLRINERTLPEGAYLTTDKVVIVDITPGILAKVNFGVNIKGRRHLPASQQAGRTEDREENGKSPAIASPDSVYRGVAISNNQVEAKSELASDRIYAKDKQANTQTGQPADPQTYTRDEQEENRLFFVVMGDAKAGYNFNKGDMEPVEDNDKFNEGFWSEGKFAYYLKGKIKGKYLITSSLDTQREQKELFRNLDPDKYYPVYGDASTINYDATNTQGRLYLLIEWDKSKVLWGNYVTGLTDTEFAQFNRTLYGGKIHFESVSSTKFAEPVTKLIVFDARAKQRAAHNEFVGTGGSLFYLKHSNIIEGSEKIKIEIRDKITGIVLTTKQMQSGFDYEIDYSNGRVIFGQSVSSIAESSSIISSQLLDGNSVCVVVDYEYEAKDNYDKGTQGVRLQQSLTDYLTVGGTYVKEEQQDKDYELKGLDVTIHLGKNIAVTAEQAESKSGQAGSFISTDGGLSFTELTNLDSDKGKAYGIKSEAYLFDKLGLTNYYKKIEGGFSSTSTISQQGKELFGAGLTWDINPKTKLALSHDEQKLIDDGNPQTQLQVGAEETKTTSAQITHQMEKLRLTGEYRHQAVTDKNDEFESETNRDEDTVAAKADYKLTEKVGISLEQQTTLRGETNNQTSVGISAQPNERLFFKAKQTVGTEGSATSVGTTVNINDKISAHTTLAVADSMEKGQTQSVVVGSQQKVNEGLVITTDKTYAKNRDTLIEGNTLGLTKEKDNRKLKGAFTQQQSQNNTETANTNIFGLSGDINDKLAMMGSFERGVVQNHDGTQATRSAGALGMSYADKNPETDNIRLQASSKLELRTDDGEEDKKQYFIYNALKWQSTINTTLFAKINISQTENTSNDSTEAQYKELVTGVAYRPIYFDRLNLLARYTYLEDSLPSDQTDFSNIEEERAHTLSGELAYDLTDKLQLVEKLAYKFGEEKVEGFDFTKTQTWLNIHRLNYNINNNWQFGAEYRFLTQKEAEDSKQGALVEVNRKIGEFVQIGAGYNFTEFNDDLTYLDYTSQGPFVRLTAMLYDRTPEEVERARQRVQEEKINQWIWELVNEELAKPNSPIMLKLNYYYNTAKKLQAEGKTKDAKELYEKIQMTSDMMYNEAEKYIRRRLELEKRIKEDNQIALVYYKQGKFKEAKELWEKITKEAKPEPIFIKF
ncbi:MAG: DUF11 domain-containing protein, partial [Candidatus Omnitrophica bacterium]|nr:DUF11 domain-containing protein [Candidatus Omnitrophota bacterium]MBU1889261.1 DUF11 domain-containing protein [Candidatus Omnitrophota bacterium]